MDAAAAKAVFTHGLLDICQADRWGRLSVRPMKRGWSNNQNTTCQNLLAMPTRQVIENDIAGWQQTSKNSRETKGQLKKPNSL